MQVGLAILNGLVTLDEPFRYLRCLGDDRSSAHVYYEGIHSSESIYCSLFSIHGTGSTLRQKPYPRLSLGVAGLTGNRIAVNVLPIEKDDE